jgi:hypothetical protein
LRLLEDPAPDAGVQVYTGKRDGVTGSLRLNVAF